MKRRYTRLRIQRTWSSISRPARLVLVPGLSTRWKRTKRLHLGDLPARHGACPQSDLVPGTEASPGNLAVRSRRHERLVRDKCLQQWYKDADASAQEEMSDASSLDPHRRRRGGARA